MTSIFDDYESRHKNKKEEEKEIPKKRFKRFTNPYDDIKQAYGSTKRFVKKHEPIIKQTGQSVKKVIGLTSKKFGVISSNYRKHPVLNMDTPIWERNKKKHKKSR